MYVLTVDGFQAIAQTKEQAVELLVSKFSEHVNDSLSKKRDECNSGNVQRIYFNAEIGKHEGSTGWTKKTR